MRETALQLEFSAESYEKNLEKLALYDPLTAVRLGEKSFDDYHYCYTHLGELNIVRRAGKNSLFYSDIEGARSEAKEWYRKNDFKNYRLLFFYGLGLGYYYECLKHWLRQDPKNRLIFLEDELGVVDRFLGTKLAEEILNDRQVVVQAIDLCCKNNISASIHKGIDHLLRGYVKGRSFLGASKLYSGAKEALCLAIRDVIFAASGWHIMNFNEIMSLDSNVLYNHYYSLIRQHRSANGHGFKGKFRNIPALICGAGPSIVHDIEKIAPLKDRALIIGSGTGMNVLNYYGINPHFGIGLDPTESQGTRIRTNFAYEVPLFYRPRFHAPSFSLHQGEKIYIQGYPSDPLTSWFDNELGLELEELYDQGISSTNFSMQIARMMGCNPIILLGIDLAYVDASRYPSIIAAHPTDHPLSKEEITSKSDVPLYGMSNSKGQLLTKIDWFEEAKTITCFALRSPELKVISCSKEGLAIGRVEYMPFERAVESYMKRSYDLAGAIHLEIEENSPTAKEGLCREKVGALKASSDKCSLNLHALEEEVKVQWDAAFAGKRLPIAPYNGKIALLEEEIWCEPAYRIFGEELTRALDQMAFDKKIERRCHSETKSQREIDILELEIDLNYLVLFEKHLNHHARLLEFIIAEYEEEEKLLERGPELPLRPEPGPSEGEYRIEGESIAIADSEMGIELKSPFTPQRLPACTAPPPAEHYLEKEGAVDGEYRRYRASGELMQHSFYREGLLHGPSAFFYSEGTLASNCWYVEGKKIGKSFRWYKSGKLFSLERYRGGSRDGLQEYFFEGGGEKSILSYKEGLLDGAVTLYYRNGEVKRSLQFSEGTLDGKELYYSPGGGLIWEAEYRKGAPVGYARVYYKGGGLSREYFYPEGSAEYSYKEWNKMGVMTAKEERLKENLEGISDRRKEELMKAVKKFDRELKKMQQIAKHERMQFLF